MAELVYVDNSNVFIEGQRVKAVATGQAESIHDAMSNGILDQSFKIDFGRLHDFIAGANQSEIKRCMLFGSRPPENDSLWQMARNAGFEDVVEDRNAANKEKKIDTGIATAMMKDAYTVVKKYEDTITLVSGDTDFVPCVKELVEDGFNVEVVFWDHAGKELREKCRKFISLNNKLDHLEYK